MAIPSIMQPSGSTEVQMREFWSGNSYTKTLDEIMAMAKEVNSSADTIVLNGYNDGYIYSVRIGVLGTVDTLYLRDYFGDNFIGTLGWNGASLGGGSTLFNIKRDGSGLEAMTTVWDTTSRSYDGKTYEAYDGNDKRANIMYTVANVGKMYINDVLQANWESVKSISGKGKTYNLTEILNINDGEAVNDVSASGNVDFSKKTKVNNLIADAIQDQTKVTVHYEIPEGTYSYIKLVYKKNAIPQTYSDGTAIDIDQSDTETEITGIVDGSTYYFVIFTNLSVSEEKMFSSNISEINFFTSDFNSALLVDDWVLADYKHYNVHYGGFEPSMFSDYYLSRWNFLVGNEWANYTIVKNGNELCRSARAYNRSDMVFWIPIKRITGNLTKIIADYAITSQVHYGEGYDWVGFYAAYVDSNNEWHMKDLGAIKPSDEDWHTNGVFDGSSNISMPYIDYIGIFGFDGILHVKNIKLIVAG